jgi:dihydroorotate dehydrogenase
MYTLTSGCIPLIGVGGISTGEDALKMIKAGATLIQVYTVLVMDGPDALDRIKRELATALKREGYTCVTEAVGDDVSITRVESR